MSFVRDGLMLMGALTALAGVSTQVQAQSARAPQTPQDYVDADRAAIASSGSASRSSSAAAATYTGPALIYPPGTPPRGTPYTQLAADWWKWALKTPANRTPLIDPTGANCAQGQSSSYTAPWFLAGTFEDQPVTRSCTVGYGRFLLLPVLNAISAAFPSDPANQKTEAYLRAQIAYLELATNLTLVIDGRPVNNIASWYEESVKFSVTLPANNVYGLPTGQLLNPAYDAGFYLAVSFTTPGRHTIHWTGSAEAGDQDITYNLNLN